MRTRRRARKWKSAGRRCLPRAGTESSSSLERNGRRRRWRGASCSTSYTIAARSRRTCARWDPRCRRSTVRAGTSRSVEPRFPRVTRYLFVTCPSLAGHAQVSGSPAIIRLRYIAGPQPRSRMVTMRKLATLVAALLLPASLLSAQGTTIPPIDFSGVLFGNFGWRTDDAAKALTGGKPLSKFDVGRAYLTFRMQAGEKGSIRVTTDIFNQTPSTYYNGWTVRLKYGYFQYDFTKNLAGVQGLSALGRIGMLHTVVVEHIEGFWPRYITNTADEIYFNWSSADVGASSLLTLPKKRG